MHTQDFIQSMKDRLTEEKERLQEELSGLPEHTEMGDDMDSGTTEFETDEVNQDIRAQLKLDLAAIEAAFDRIEQGSYGVCSVGGEDIPESRLEVLPWAETCVEHQDA
jgi:DnaK suppressor protein